MRRETAVCQKEIDPERKQNRRENKTGEEIEPERKRIRRGDRTGEEIEPEGKQIRRERFREI